MRTISAIHNGKELTLWVEGKQVAIECPTSDLWASIRYIEHRYTVKIHLVAHVGGIFPVLFDNHDDKAKLDNSLL